MLKRPIFLCAGLLGTLSAAHAEGAGKPSVVQASPPVAATTKAPAIVRPKPITRAEFVARIDAQFDQVDADHDGLITRPEIDAAQVRLNARVTAAETKRAEQRFVELDTNHDGQLSEAEYTAPIAKRKVITDGSAALARLDSNKDGKVSREEFRATPLSTFDRLDANKDGAVAPAERPKVQLRR